MTSTDRMNPGGPQQGQQAIQRQPLPSIANSFQPPGHSTANGAPAAYPYTPKKQPELEQQKPPPLELDDSEPEPEPENQQSSRSRGGGKLGGGGDHLQWTARSGAMSEEDQLEQEERIRKLMFSMRQAELKRRLQETSRREESEAIEQALTAFHDEYQLNPSNDEDVKLVIRAERQLEFARVKEGNSIAMLYIFIEENAV